MYRLGQENACDLKICVYIYIHHNIVQSCIKCMQVQELKHANVCSAIKQGHIDDNVGNKNKRLMSRQWTSNIALYNIPQGEVSATQSNKTACYWKVRGKSPCFCSLVKFNIQRSEWSPVTWKIQFWLVYTCAAHGPWQNFNQSPFQPNSIIHKL